MEPRDGRGIMQVEAATARQRPPRPRQDEFMNPASQRGGQTQMIELNSVDPSRPSSAWTWSKKGPRRPFLLSPRSEGWEVRGEEAYTSPQGSSSAYRNKYATISPVTIIVVAITMTPRGVQSR